MNLLVHIWESQLKSSNTRQKFKSFIVEVRFVRSTQTSNITQSFFISNWLFHIFLQTKRFRTIPIFWAPPRCELGDEKKEKKKLVLSKPCRCLRLFAKASNNGSQGCENPFSTELVRKHLHFTSNIGWKSCICIFISSVVARAWGLDRWTFHRITNVQ